MALVDKSTGTLKQILSSYNLTQWADSLKKATAVYNNRSHAHLMGSAPEDVEGNAEILHKLMLDAGENPKELVIEECKPMCTHWQEKLARCEKSLETIVKINPTKTCLYPMRDWVTCVEACAQPVIHNSLKGTH